ncbi:MAG: hypothetical protein IPH11_13535 [Ignavibacteriales bacterium]|nr:hypothetical protein [Ignavibacteriales bacterium]
MLKLNEIGDTLWTKIFAESHEVFYKVYEIEYSKLILTGTRVVIGDRNIVLLKTDSFGNVEWEKTYDYANEPDYGYSVQQTSDGGYIVAGGASPPDIENRGWIIRTDSIGEIIWTKFINSYTESVCYSLLLSSSGSQRRLKISWTSTPVTFQQEVMLLRIASDIVPVELISFTVQNSVSHWQTNNSGFEVERKQVGSSQSSVSNLEWNQIAFIPWVWDYY